MKMQVQCYSTPGVVYKYVKLTRTEETRKLLWNAKLCINTCGLSRFFNARLPGGSYCMRCMRYVFADIVRAHHETLWRIVAEAQLAPVFVQKPPNMKKCGFLPKLPASCALAVGRRQYISVGADSVYGGLLQSVNSGRFNGP